MGDEPAEGRVKPLGQLPDRRQLSEGHMPLQLRTMQNVMELVE
jgi:hypothetical protein